MRPSSRIKLVSFLCVLLTVAASLTFLGLTRGTSHASSIQKGTATTTTKSNCGSWQVVPLSLPFGVSTYEFNGVVALSPNNVWAVGYYIEHWNGTSWSTVSNPANADLYAVAAISANNIWTVGSAYSNGTSEAFIEHWNGVQWSAVSNSPVNGSLYAVTVLTANNIWAVGQNDTGTLVEHWNGTQWSVVSSPNLNFPFSRLNAIAAVSANDIWVVGQSNSGTLTVHWDGSSWSVVYSAKRGSDGGSLYSVAHVPRTGKLWAVDSYTQVSEDYNHMLAESYC